MRERRGFGTIRWRSDRRAFYVGFTWGGPRYWRRGGAKRRAAERKLALLQGLFDKGVSLEEALEEVFGEVMGSRMTMRDLEGSFIEARDGRVRETTLTNDKQRFRRILKLAPFAAKQLGSVRTEDIEAWTAELEDRKLSGPTINRSLSLVSRFFAWARKRGFVASNPVRDVERYSETGRGRIDFLTPEECNILLEGAEATEGEMFHAFLMTLLLIGARRSEGLRLRWQDVDFEGGEIRIPPEADKIGQGRAIPMDPSLEAVLGRLKKARKVIPVGKAADLDRSDLIFTRKDRSPLTPKVLSLMMERTKRGLDLPRDRKRIIGFHVLRHTCVSLLRQAGVDLADVGRIMGHRSLQTTMRYSHLWAEGTREAVQRLGAILAQAKAAGKVKGSGA